MGQGFVGIMKSRQKFALNPASNTWESIRPNGPFSEAPIRRYPAIADRLSE